MTPKVELGFLDFYGHRYIIPLINVDVYVNEKYFIDIIFIGYQNEFRF